MRRRLRYNSHTQFPLRLAADRLPSRLVDDVAHGGV